MVTPKPSRAKGQSDTSLRFQSGDNRQLFTHSIRLPCAGELAPDSNFCGQPLERERDREIIGFTRSVFNETLYRFSARTRANRCANGKV
jgi:hypothetical protein